VLNNFANIEQKMRKDHQFHDNLESFNFFNIFASLSQQTKFSNHLILPKSNPLSKSSLSKTPFKIIINESTVLSSQTRKTNAVDKDRLERIKKKLQWST
jgi:hypothetical protein